MQTLYDFSARTLQGQTLPMGNLRGKVVLVVNTASRCSFTPQYADLQTVHELYHGRGLEVLAFPCNQFGRQEPGSAADIAGFCRTNYGVSFRIFEKIDVNGPAAHPLFKWLTRAAPGFLGTRRIKWNFTKFLIGPDGRVFKRYGSWTKPQDIAGDVERLLP